MKFQSKNLELESLFQSVHALRAFVVESGDRIYKEWRPSISRRAFRLGGRNFAYYLALRQRDIRDLQVGLMAAGFSSLGRSESRVLPNLDAVVSNLGIVTGRPSQDLPPRPLLKSFFRGQRLLNSEATRIFGIPQHRRRVRLMVTLGAETGTDYSQVRALILSGMDVARINCAHDTQDQWASIIANVREAEKETGRQCKVEMDLCGPRFRIGRVKFPNEKVRVHTGDQILMTNDATPPGTSEWVQFQALPSGVASQVSVGHSVWINDGKLGTKVEQKKSTVEKDLLSAHP
ncbi:MAG: pyruvate kinase [Bdellovibrionia bacterium]